MKQSLGAKTIVLPAPVFIVGSYDEQDHPNIMTAAWGGICGSDPPCLTVSIRPARLTYENIMRRRAYTVSIPSVSQAREADYAGLCSGRDGNKFEALGLTPVRSKLVDAPYVGEFPLTVECRLRQTVELGVHTLFIGEIMDVKVEDWAMNESGVIAVEKLRPLTFSPADGAYYGLGDFVGKAFSIGKK
ncbi:MAG: flavin reductase family protein [bacterium]|nr:flavin reductase family protein [bacterium]